MRCGHQGDDLKIKQDQAVVPNITKDLKSPVFNHAPRSLLLSLPLSGFWLMGILLNHRDFPAHFHAPTFSIYRHSFLPELQLDIPSTDLSQLYIFIYKDLFVTFPVKESMLVI